MTRSSGTMTGILCAAFIAVCAQGAGTRAVGAGTAKRPPKLRPYPLYCAGIAVRMSTERDVRRLFGPGLVVTGEGHGRGRYYVDPTHRATLHVEIGVDSFIEHVEYRKGVKLPPGPDRAKRLRQAEARWLHADETYGVGEGLGGSSGAVIEELGPPTSRAWEDGEEVLYYRATAKESPYALDYAAAFHYRKGLLVAVGLSNSD